MASQPPVPWPTVADGTVFDRRRARPGRAVVVAAGVLALAPATVAAALYLWPPTGDRGAMAASFVGYGLPLALAALPLLAGALRGSRRGARLLAVVVLAAVVATLHLSWALPFYVADGRPVVSGPLTVLSLNLRHAGATPAGVWPQARRADVVVLLEFDDFAPDAVPDGAWDRRFPYRVGYVNGGWSSTVVYSRYPLTEAGPLPSSTIAKQWTTTLTTPQLGKVTVMAVHPCNPQCGSGLWASEHAEVESVAASRAGGPLIVAGDFNAVDEHLPMRRLAADGLESATDIAGAGWLPTYPADRPYGLPPLIPIDHILLSRQLTATSVTRVRVAGTDHLGLVATVAATR